jgi:zinc and cadmium transporter
MIGWILAFGLLASLGSVALASTVLLFPDTTRRTLVPCLISYAVGTLLGAAFLGLLPHALGLADARTVLAATLAGIVLFFVLEKLVLWRHCHSGDCEVHGRAAAWLILVGDALHNFVDGVVVAAAFLVSVPVGVATGLAVVAHELPQEVGDFAILLEGGFSRGRAFLWNGVSSLTALAGALLGYLSLADLRTALPLVLAVSAASFIYVAVADLIPSLHQRASGLASLRQLTLVLGGIATIGLFQLGR